LVKVLIRSPNLHKRNLAVLGANGGQGWACPRGIHLFKGVTPVSSNRGRVLEADKEERKITRKPLLVELERNPIEILRDNVDGNGGKVGQTNLAHLDDVTFTLANIRGHRLRDSWQDRKGKASCK
jgi:hypothetical protein